jgi:hypothetical protein
MAATARFCTVFNVERLITYKLVSTGQLDVRTPLWLRPEVPAVFPVNELARMNDLMTTPLLRKDSR